jgi:hypothetical protein
MPGQLPSESSAQTNWASGNARYTAQQWVAVRFAIQIRFIDGSRFDPGTYNRGVAGISILLVGKEDQEEHSA